jgi:hypothetical protein
MIFVWNGMLIAEKAYLSDPHIVDKDIPPAPLPTSDKK